MNHQFYIDLLFTDQELAPQETVALHEHLQSCESCSELASAWSEVENQLHAAPVVAPQPHFVNRWGATLETYKNRNVQKQNRFMLVITWGAAALFFAALVFLAWPLLESPKVVILTYLYQLIGMLSVVNIAREVISAFFQGISAGIPLIWLIILAGVIIEIIVLWVVSIRYLSKPRRVTL